MVKAKDSYHEIMASFLIWRLGTFPWYYRRKFRRQQVKELTEAFGYVPCVGDVVEDCRLQVHTIVFVDPEDLDSVILDDGARCSLINCCDQGKR